MQEISIIDLMQIDLGFESGYLEKLDERSDSLYKKHFINNRRIDAPDPELKIVQCWISDFLRATTPKLPSYVSAYEYDCSIIKNAKLHANSVHILTLDIKAFFPSCTEELVRDYFQSTSFKIDPSRKARKLNKAEIDLLVGLSCYQGSLSVGAPSSPAIANRLMASIDVSIIEQLKKHDKEYLYSRYSDDITISSKEWINTEAIVSLVSAVLEQSGFILNDKKTHCRGKGDRRRITGLYLSPDGRISLGAKRKKELKHELYLFLLHQEGNQNSLIGKINFAQQVEPRFVANVLSKYANYGAAKGVGVMKALTM